jgi:hypothetical protein
VEDEKGRACSMYEADEKCIKKICLGSLRGTDHSEVLDIYRRII